MINTILFDLDGTLLPLDERRFIELYMGLLARHFAPYGYDPKAFVQAVWAGTEAMRNHPGETTNEIIFWQTFAPLIPDPKGIVKTEFERFYREVFQGVQISSSRQPLARVVIDRLKQKGYTIALATNPLFPAIATHQRIRWAGLEVDDFSLITTYENQSAAKPHARYYQGILNALGKTAAECLMVGNDASEDGAAANLGMGVYLITDCLINSKDRSLDAIPHGDFQAFADFVDSLPNQT
ncbi:MAG: HAD family hydrolase [Bacillus subtilis]|nr:HAD family hydrolase [Bacillus subtilis]